MLRFVHALLLAALVEILGPPAPAKSERQAEKQTLAGAQERANRTLEWWNRGRELARENTGARGRLNSTSDEADVVERNRVTTPGFSEWARPWP